MIRAYITASSIGMMLALPAVAAPIDTSELARCHAMPTRDERLDCYEALATGAIASGPTASTVSSAGGPAATAAGPAGPTASSAAPAASTAAAPRPVPPSAPAPASSPAGSFDPDNEANFGLNRRQVEPHPGGPSAVKSIVS